MNSPDSDLWRSAAEIFDVAVILEGADREAFVSRSCGGNPRLETAVRDLLVADSEKSAGLDPIGIPKLLSVLAKLRPGEAVGAWHILRELGAGGMGTVYLAERREGDFDQLAAIKVLALGVEAERFRQERQVLAHLAHPNIATLIDGGTLHGSRPYVVMEYVDGRPLDAWCREVEPSLAEILNLFCKLGAAIAHAHRKLVVHRDLKPANVLVRADGEPKLLDFGIAKILSDAESGQAMHVTAAQVRVMTPGYASPEQVEGEPVSTATDIYSLGVMLYELVAGERPFASKEHERASYERAVLESRITPPSRVKPLPPLIGGLSRTRRIDLDSIILRMLDRQPEARYRTVAEVIDDLEAFMAIRPVRARRATRFYAFRKLLARNPVASAAIGTLATLTSVLLITSLVISHRLRIERDAAEAARRQAEFTTNVLTDAFRVADPVVANKPVSLDEVLNRAYSDLRDAGGLSGALPAEIPAVLGHVFVATAKYDRAAQLLKAAYVKITDDEPETSVDAGRLASSLAYLNIQLENYAEAARYNTIALESAYFAASSLPVRIAMEHQRALILAGLGEVKEAIGVAERALESAQSAQEGALLHRAYRLQRTLSGFHSLLGNDNSEVRYLEAAVLTASELEDFGSDRVSALRSVASLLERQGDAAAAMDVLRESLLLAEDLFGKSHPEVARVHRQIGNTYYTQRDFVEARASYERALQVFGDHFGPSHETTIQIQYNMSLANKRLGDLGAAARYLLGAIKGYESWGDVRRTELPYFYWSLGLLRREQGELGAAEEAFLRSIDLNAHLERSRDQREELGQASVSLGELYLELEDEILADRFLRAGAQILSQLGSEAQMLERASTELQTIRARWSYGRSDDVL